jgi:hypothetical protein
MLNLESAFNKNKPSNYQTSTEFYKKEEVNYDSPKIHIDDSKKDLKDIAAASRTKSNFYSKVEGNSMEGEEKIEDPYAPKM